MLPIADDSDVEISFGAGRLGVEENGAKVVSQLLSGTYPNWERVVPPESTRVWSVEADQLEEKVKRIMIIARDNASRVRFKGSGDQILIAARSDEKGEAKEEIPIKGKELGGIVGDCRTLEGERSSLSVFNQHGERLSPCLKLCVRVLGKPYCRGRQGR